MTRNKRFKTLCNVLALFLLIVALRQLVDPVLTAIDPVLGTAELNCSPCRYETDPVRLMDPTIRAEAWATPGLEARIVERLELPRVRLLLLLASATAYVPLCLVFLFLTLALRSFAESGFRSGAERWLKLTAGAALLWAVAGPLSRGFGTLALDAVLSGHDRFRIVLDMYHLARGLMIAGAALAVIWVLREGAEHQDDLDRYV
jgi:hypothetical protein